MQDEDDMSLPQSMQALVLRCEGLAETTSGLAVADLGALVALARMRAVPTPGPGRSTGPGRVGVGQPVGPALPQGRVWAATPARHAGRFEGTGTVVAAADGQAAALVGRRVSFLASASGFWAEFALTDAAACVEVDAGVSDDDAAALLVNPLTAVAMIALVAAAGARAVVLPLPARAVGADADRPGARAGHRPGRRRA